MPDDPVITIEPDQLTAAPGGQAQARVRVTNPTTLVQGYRISLLGDRTAGWGRVSPTHVDVYPGDERQVNLAFSVPPGSPAQEGRLPFGVLVSSTVDGSSAAAEGSLTVGSQRVLQARLRPATAAGRWRARQTLTVTNYGNGPARVHLAASDPEDALGFWIQPRDLTIRAGATARARITVRTRQPALVGSGGRHPFTVAVEPAGIAPTAGPPALVSTTERPLVDAAFQQKPILGRSVLLPVSLAVLALVSVVVYTLKGPTSTERLYQPGAAPMLTPVLSSATYQAPASVKLNWGEVPDATAYDVHQVIADVDVNLETLTGNQKIVAGVPYDKKVCFYIVAVSGEMKSAPSNAKCVGTPSRPISPDAWIAVVVAPAKPVPPLWKKAIRALADQQIAAATIERSKWPQMKPAIAATPESKLLYIGPYDSEEDALTDCNRATLIVQKAVPKLTDMCMIAQPGPAE